jgi:hypothetical protein
MGIRPMSMLTMEELSRFMFMPVEELRKKTVCNPYIFTFILENTAGVVAEQVHRLEGQMEELR